MKKREWLILFISLLLTYVILFLFDSSNQEIDKKLIRLLVTSFISIAESVIIALLISFIVDGFRKKFTIRRCSIVYMVVLAFVIIIHLTGGQKSNDSLFKPSYKEQMSSLKKDFVEYIDTINNQYSNYKYGFAIKFPKNWIIDQGVAEHTIVRAIQKDSLFSFSVNIIESNYKINSFWDYYDKHKEEYDNNFIGNVKNSQNINVQNLRIKKIYIANYEAIQYLFEFDVKQLDFEYTMHSTLYQVFKDNSTYSIGFIVPKVFYLENLYFDKLINGFNFIDKKSKL